MSSRLFHRRFLRVISFTAILSGFTYLSWGVSKEYFEYRTSSHIAIRDYPEDGVKAPAVALCFHLKYGKWLNSTEIGQLFTGEENYFNDWNDSWIVKEAFGRTPDGKLTWLTKKFIIRNRYCMLFKVLNEFKMEDVTSTENADAKYFYWIKFSTSPFKSDYVSGYKDRPCYPKFVYAQFIMDESTLSNPSNREWFQDVCSEGLYKGYIVGLTYSSLVNIRLPSPYDTNCLEYKKEGNISSSHECYDTCIKDQTEQLNIIPITSVIDRETYKTSKAYMTDAKTIGDDIKQYCRQSCYRPDCLEENLSPRVGYLDWIMPSNGQSNETLSSFEIAVLTSSQPILEASTAPKQRLLDYIIYMSSMLSFWLGFCPLSLVEATVTRWQEWSKKRIRVSQTLDETVRIQNGRIHCLEGRSQSQEDTIRILVERIRILERELSRLSIYQ